MPLQLHKLTFIKHCFYNLESMDEMVNFMTDKVNSQKLKFGLISVAQLKVGRTGKERKHCCLVVEKENEVCWIGMYNRSSVVFHYSSLTQRSADCEVALCSARSLVQSIAHPPLSNKPLGLLPLRPAYRSPRQAFHLYRCSLFGSQELFPTDIFTLCYVM